MDTKTATAAPSDDIDNDGGLDAAAAAIAGLLDPDEGQTKQAADQEQAADTSDETDADADEADAQEEKQADDDAEPKAKAEADAPTVTVEIDGKPVALTHKEIADGYLRQSDYTRKTQALSAEREAVRDAAMHIRNEQARLAELLPLAEKVVQAQIGAEPDWAKLEAEDPIGFAVEAAKWQRHRDTLAAMRAEQGRLAEAREREFMTQAQAKIEAEKAALLKAAPDLADPKVFDATRKEMREYLSKAGATDEEINTLADHRIVLLVRKAMAYDRLQEAKTKVVTVAGPAQRLATAQPNGKTRARAEANFRLSKSGSLRDAASAIELLI